MRNRSDKGLFTGIDPIALLIYILLVAIGLVTIYAASFNGEHSMIYDPSQKYGMQFIWILVSFAIAITISLLDNSFFYTFALPSYFLMVGILLFVAFFGKEVNGARSWFQLGPISIQPSEFAKFATGLAIAKFLSTSNFNPKSFRDIAMCSAIALLPALAIMLQPDAGSALVFSAFLVVLYREGISRLPYIAIFLMVLLFVLSFTINLTPLIFVIFTTFCLIDGLTESSFRPQLRYWGATSLVWLLSILINSFFDFNIDGTLLLLGSFVVTLPMVVVYRFRTQTKSSSFFLLLFTLSVGFLYSVSFLFSKVMKIHQQKRILDLLGLERDVRGWGYNLNQSKIAIGSGGLSGKGFLQGTQTKLDFVPEQSTDFIFCTIGEEWGFVGTSLVVLLFTTLIFRLIWIAERQGDLFGRVYCYYVAAIFLIHMLVNIGMTIGVLPVIGIPLPFFSYGGSSLMAFTILLFIALKLNSRRSESYNF